MDTELRPSRHRFELGGGSITEGRMTAAPIVEHFQPLKDVLLGLRPCPIPSMVYELRFQCMKEAFNDGLVLAGGASAHIDRDALVVSRARYAVAADCDPRSV